MIDRRQLIISSFAPLLLNAAPKQQAVVIAGESDIGRIRKIVRRDNSGVWEKLVQDALNAGPWSVTYHRPAASATKAGPNDYYSEGPYWWPDPRHPGGAYIRKDGQRNPGRFTANHSDLSKLCDAVLSLGMGALLLGKSECLNHARKILSVWFIDPKTRMNPNLEYGQAIPGVSTGRGTGIIDTVALIYAAQGIALLQMSGLDDGTLRGTHQWYADYVQWMNSSTKGLNEKSSGNNHATWWTAQAAAYASLIQDSTILEMAWRHYRDYLVPNEIRPDGSCPREEQRTRSLSYSTMNLDAFAVICRLAQMHGTDLWHYRAPNGGSVEKAFSYLMPFVLKPDTWRKKQIATYSAGTCIFPGLAGLGLPSQRFLADYGRLPRAHTPWVQFVDLIVKSSRRIAGRDS